MPAGPHLLASLSFLLAINPTFPSHLYGDVLGALQALARTAGCLALPNPRDAFLTALAKAALPPRVVSALDELPQAQQTPCSPVLLEGLTLGLTGSGAGSGSGSGAGLSPRNLPCLRVLVAAARFLAGTLGVSWFAVLEALQFRGLRRCNARVRPTKFSDDLWYTGQAWWYDS